MNLSSTHPYQGSFLAVPARLFQQSDIYLMVSPQASRVNTGFATMMSQLRLDWTSKGRFVLFSFSNFLTVCLLPLRGRVGAQTDCT